MTDSDIQTVIERCGSSSSLVQELVQDPAAFGARFNLSQRDVEALVAADALILFDRIDCSGHAQTAAPPTRR